MVDNAEGLVALFIDWDNLAISVAADLGGATPDLKRIMQTAQTFGKILIARAYAEWNATSERLTVYRAGIEPVYAPTFRFEPDPLTQGARGKSLADPCMVADSIDILHLLPNITTYVIVSGDKDLIPVVRLAQLRGKFVAVIGPDYAAGVLRDIADEFISYRSILEQENGRLVETGDGARGGRRPQPSRGVQQQPVTAQRGRRQPAAPLAPARSRPREMPPVTEAVQTAPPVIAEAVEPSKPEAAVEAAGAQRGPSYDLATVYENAVEILKQRASEGKVRLRATNLKDNLMARIPGFSERKFGFSKFKDFLVAAQKAGVVDVTVVGPVHWVSLPTKPEESIESAPAITTITPRPAEEATAESPELSELADERFGEIVRFIIDLRGRSRWLTYTYVLTNLISFLGKVAPQVDAESAARSTLSRLVQEDILRIDREPQEVEVGGIKHRVRMCHLEESHPFVADMAAIVEAERKSALPSEAPAGERAEQQAAPERPEEPGRWIEEAPAGETEGAAERAEPAVAAAAEDAAAVAASGSPESLVEPPTAGQDQEEGVKSQPYAASPEKVGGTLSLDDAYAVLGRVVRQSTISGKPRVRLTGLKAKLTGELGHFDEQAYGFKRFKDFTLAAEKKGWIKLETVGPVTWVTTAAQEEPKQAPEQKEEPEKENEEVTARGPESMQTASPTVPVAAVAEDEIVSPETLSPSEGSGASQEAGVVLPAEGPAGEEKPAETRAKRSRGTRRRSQPKQPEVKPQEVLVE